MKKCRITAIMLTFIFAFTSVIGSFSFRVVESSANKKKASKGAGYGISNPVTSNGVTTWDTVYFGNYYQNDTNGDGTADENDTKQPIRWRVLSVDGDDAFLLADQNLDCKKYNETFTDITWADCTLRTWLNSTFLTTAFTSAEQSAIKNTSVVNDDNPNYGIQGGVNTTDKVYLLSIDEVRNASYGFNMEFNAESESRQAKNTAYAEARGAWTSTRTGFKGNGWWWLRSPGNYSNYAAVVSYGGWGSFNGNNINNVSSAARPALHLSLSASSLWSKGEKVSANVGKQSSTTSTPTPSSPPTSTPTPTIISSSFTLGKDNNNFTHYASSVKESGFYQVKNYKVSKDYFAKLTQYASKGEISDLKKYMSSPWNGSCYGIASTMGLVYNGLIKISDMNDTNAKSYFTLPKPKDDKRLLQSINYYQMSQILKMNKVKTFRIAACYQGLCPNNQYSDSLETFLNKIVSTATTGKAYLLAFCSKDGGHTILVTGCEYDSENHCYKVQLYDENSASISTCGGFSEMTIADDFQSFNIQNEVNEANYRSLDYFDIDKMNLTLEPVSSDIKLNAKSNRIKSTESETTTLRFDAKKPVQIKNSKGQYLNYDGDRIDTNLNIFNMAFSDELDGVMLEIEIPLQEEIDLTFSENECSINIVNKDNYKAIDASGVKSASIDMKNCVELCGDNISFNVYSSTDTKVNDKEDSLVSVSGTCKDGLKVNCDTNVSAFSTSGITDATTNVLYGTEESKKSYEGAAATITVNPSENMNQPETPTPVPTPTLVPMPSNPVTPITPTTPKKANVKAPGKVKLNSAKNKKEKKIAVSFKKLKNSKGYQLQYALNKNFKKAKMVLTKKTSFTIQKLKKKKTYYIRVRAYKLNGAKKVYGKWSNVKKVKVKK